MDYIGKLSDSEKHWLAAFNEGHYGGNPEILEEITGHATSQGESRRLWREIKRYQRDTLSICTQVEQEHTQEHLCEGAAHYSGENAMIDRLDLAQEIERGILKVIRIQIRTKEWK